jgi:3-dehydroquinate synthase
MKDTFIIKSAQGNSEISLVNNAFTALKQGVKKEYKGKHVAVITDTNVAGLYHDKIRKALPEADILVIKAGEKSKTMKVAEVLCEDLLENGFGRKDLVIGFGGGMVTDLAGFVASIFMRGVDYMAVPTSLLAMVDASVGGKTGVNATAKNTVGTFYPAKKVLVDQRFLKTLPERELKTGMAEIIKYSAMLDASLTKELKAKKPDYSALISKSISAKAGVCNKDLKEEGLRKILNFGHTLGHAIEHLSKYKLTHGEVVSIGMVLANRVAQKLGVQKEADGEMMSELLQKYDLPTEIPKNISLQAIVEMVYKDKKMEGKEVNFILSRGMGKYEIVKITPTELKKLLTH